jgi:tetratricopeptide (TPR) repeat protein
VYNNLGLAHYQLAQRALASCDAAAATRFWLPTALDPETLARRTRTRGTASPCREDAAMRREARAAMRDLEHAAAQDPGYLPARLNLASALLLLGEPARALSVAEEALKLDADHEAALNGKALALYLYGEQAGIETAEFALRMLSERRERGAAAAITLYNQAAMLEERGRSAAAAEAWRGLVGAMPAGPYREAALRRGGVGPEARDEGVSRHLETPRAAVPLGRISSGAARALSGLRRRAFDLGAVQGALYGGRRLRALEIDRSLEILEEDLARPEPAAAAAAWGPPEREIEAANRRTLVYRGFACDVVGDAIVRRVHFAPAR